MASMSPKQQRELEARRLIFQNMHMVRTWLRSLASELRPNHVGLDTYISLYDLNRNLEDQRDELNLVHILYFLTLRINHCQKVYDNLKRDHQNTERIQGRGFVSFKDGNKTIEIPYEFSINHLKRDVCYNQGTMDAMKYFRNKMLDAVDISEFMFV